MNSFPAYNSKYPQFRILSGSIIAGFYQSLLRIVMNNNDVLKKLRVALMLRDDEIVEILKGVDFRISKSEIGAFCRREGHPNYRECGDQVLRNFLNGLVLHLRGTREDPKFPGDVLKRSDNSKTIGKGKQHPPKDKGKKKS